jgi:hypothetical protein
MTMFRNRKGGSRARPELGNVRNEVADKDIQARIVELRGLPREMLADAVFMLSIEAKQKTALIRQAIRERTDAELAFDPAPDADLATYLAADAASRLRHYDADLPTLLDVLIQRSPDVRFTVRQEEAVLLLAAMIREQRLEGILEGLRLAGILNEPSKDRHAGGYSQ